MPHRGTSNEYPQHIFSWRNKTDISIFQMKKVPYLLLCQMGQNEHLLQQFQILGNKLSLTLHLLAFSLLAHQKAGPYVHSFSPRRWSRGLKNKVSSLEFFLLRVLLHSSSSCKSDISIPPDKAFFLTEK